ncbi:MAG TPA: hypothetical protein VKQ71_08205 [Acidimicrobiales bacterium]|nr:hypothetical protein [Acidimicrobiales bacterium]
MAVQLANLIRPTHLPAYCSACYNQNPSKQHLDFDAAAERGFGDRDDGLKISMDDLILCEDCVREAARLIGMRDAGELEHDLETLTRLHRQEKDRADGLERYLTNMEAAFSSRPEPIVAPRHRGRPPGWMKERNEDAGD